MGEISKTPHVVGLISDYVLELLPGDESERVTAHLSRCPECRRAMATERQVGQSVRSTLQATSDIDQTRLRQAMPRPPVNADPDQRLLAWSPGLAAVGILLLIMCGTLVLYLNYRPAGWSSTPPAALSTAVITTNTPTQTATREIAATADQDGMLWIPEMAPASETREREAQLKPALVPIPAAPFVSLN